MNDNKPNIIPFIQGIAGLSVKQRSAILIDKGYSGDINIINWKEYNYQPSVKFYLAHDNGSLFIFYLVDEENVKATYLKDNDSVWEDSCVEAFISPSLYEGYYNFEFSCIGTALAGYGKKKNTRKRWDDVRMKQIQRSSSLNKSIAGKENISAEWWLQATIPFDLINCKRGQTIYANFYKCGDKTKQPHFLSWQPISTLQPDFHQPKYFKSFCLE